MESPKDTSFIMTVEKLFISTGPGSMSHSVVRVLCRQELRLKIITLKLMSYFSITVHNAQNSKYKGIQILFWLPVLGNQFIVCWIKGRNDIAEGPGKENYIIKIPWNERREE